MLDRPPRACSTDPTGNQDLIRAQGLKVIACLGVPSNLALSQFSLQVKCAVVVANLLAKKEKITRVPGCPGYGHTVTDKAWGSHWRVGCEGFGTVPRSVVVGSFAAFFCS